MAPRKTTAPTQLNLFVSDILSWSPKADQGSMAYPFFSLSKVRDTKIRKYESPDGHSVEIIPSVNGMATIWDKDVLIYAVSTLRDSINKGEKITSNTPINITAYNLLLSTERGEGGKSYTDLEKALDRLMGTTVKTNIPTGGTVKTEAFHLIENYRIVRSQKTGKMVSIELILNDWLWDAATNGGRDLLTVDRSYFLIKSGVERRVYEICRKHCGHQAAWTISTQKLHDKSGSTSTIREFRRILKEIVIRNELPGYTLEYDAEKDMLTSRNRIRSEALQSLGLREAS